MSGPRPGSTAKRGGFIPAGGAPGQGIGDHSRTVLPNCLRALLLAALAGPVVTGCVSAPPEDARVDAVGAIDPRNDGSGCQSLVARYADRGTGETGRSETLAEVLGLDPDTVAAVPAAERAIDLRHVAGDRYVLAIAKITPPDTVDLFAVDAGCERDELRFETRTRYESDDGVHVRRQQLRYVLIADADGTLVLRRQLRERALGLIEFRRGGDPLDTFRFPRQ